MRGTVIILAADDGAALAERVAERVEAVVPGCPIARNPAEVPPPWAPGVVVLAVVTPGLADSRLAESIDAMHRSDLPVCPVVPSIAAYDFGEMPEELAGLSTRNAVDLDTPGLLAKTVRYFLGRSVPRGARVFLSYRRTESAGRCGQIHRMLEADGYQVFVDTVRLHGGTPVQREIDEVIRESDLVLLLESPNVTDSEWVEAEMVMAQFWRTPIARVRLGEGKRFAFVHAPTFAWTGDDEDAWHALRAFINARLGERGVFDRAVMRTLREAAQATGAKLHRGSLDGGRRSWTLSTDGGRVLVHAEPPWPSLESWHALSLSHLEADCRQSLLVTGARRLTDGLRDAGRWAARDARLEMCTTLDLYRTLKQVLAEGAR